jgi:hypothetical protein
MLLLVSNFNFWAQIKLINSHECHINLAFLSNIYKHFLVLIMLMRETHLVLKLNFMYILEETNFGYL